VEEEEVSTKKQLRNQLADMWAKNEMLKDQILLLTHQRDLAARALRTYARFARAVRAVEEGHRDIEDSRMELIRNSGVILDMINGKWDRIVDGGGE